MTPGLRGLLSSPWRLVLSLALCFSFAGFLLFLSALQMLEQRSGAACRRRWKGLHTSIGLSHQAGPTAFAVTLLVDFLETGGCWAQWGGCPVAGVCVWPAILLVWCINWRSVVSFISLVLTSVVKRAGRPVERVQVDTLVERTPLSGKPCSCERCLSPMEAETKRVVCCLDAGMVDVMNWPDDCRWTCLRGAAHHLQVCKQLGW